MQRLTENKIILVTRPTRVAELRRRFNTRMQAKFYVSHLGQDFSDYEREDEHYTDAVRIAQRVLGALGRVQLIDRGVIVSTGVGSTGWFKSLLAGAAGIVQRLGPDAAKPGDPPKLAPKSELAWDADYLCFTVREPFPSKPTQAGLVVGRVTTKQPLLIESQMPEHGVIFSDGIESDFLEFRSGVRATIAPADRQGRIVV